MDDSKIKRIKREVSKKILTEGLSKMNNPEVFRHFEDLAEHFRIKDPWGLDYEIQKSMSGLNAAEYQLVLRHVGYKIKIDKNTGYLVIVGK